MPRLFFTALTALALIALPLVGCSDGNGGGSDSPAPTPDADPNPEPGPGVDPNPDPGPEPTACSNNADCGAGEVCDTEGGICREGCEGDDDCIATSACGPDGFCVSRDGCSADAPECGDGEVCNTCINRCEGAPDGGRTCTVDMNCLIDQFCDPCRKVCRPLGGACDPCEEDIECGGGDDLCLDLQSGERVCGQSCAALTDCPRGFLCEDVGGQSQCVPSSGNCVQPEQCQDSTDCPGGQQCGPQLTCIPGCSPGTCPNGDVCSAGACVPPCTGDADCPEGAECQESGLCQVPGGCLTSRDCPDAGTYCDTDQLMCVPGCEADDDCPGLQVCSGNQCRRRPCDGNHLCAFGQVCDFDSGNCVEPEGPFCDPCDAEGMNQCGGEPNQCLRISDEEGNPVGDFCGVSCDPTDLDACPVGYRCTELQDQNMMVIGNVCFRNCSRDPI